MGTWDWTKLAALATALNAAATALNAAAGSPGICRTAFVSATSPLIHPERSVGVGPHPFPTATPSASLQYLYELSAK